MNNNDSVLFTTQDFFWIKRVTQRIEGLTGYIYQDSYINFRPMERSISLS